MTDTNLADEPGYYSEEAATFGDRVAAARRAMGLTQAQLSQKLGIKLKTLHAWEEDVSEPRANKLQMLAGVLNISIIWLLTGLGEEVGDPWREEEPPKVETGEIMVEFRAIREGYRQLNDRLLRLEKKLTASLSK